MPYSSATRADGHHEAGRERAEHEVDLVLADQLLVVGDDPVRVGLVVEDLQLDLAAEQATVVVDDLRPRPRSRAGRPCRARRSLRSAAARSPTTIGSSVVSARAAARRRTARRARGPWSRRGPWPSVSGCSMVTPGSSSAAGRKRLRKRFRTL